MVCSLLNRPISGLFVVGGLLNRPIIYQQSAHDVATLEEAFHHQAAFAENVDVVNNVPSVITAEKTQKQIVKESSILPC